MWGKFVGLVRTLDGTLLAFTLLLVGVGLAELYSSSLVRPELAPLFWRQLAGFGLGSAVMLVAAFVDYRTYRSWSRLTYFTAFLLLGLVLVFGQTIRGTTGWFRIFGFGFQPIEVVKFMWVIVLASYLTHVGPPLDIKKTVSATVLLMPLLLLVLLQPDFGSGFLLIVSYMALLVAVPKPKSWWLGMLGVIIAVSLVGALFLKDYQRERLQNFLSPQSDPLDSGYNVTQSVIAVGAGGLWGRGLGLGTQSQLKFLPEQHTDFIFASLAEELGLIGGVLVLGLWVGFLGRLIWLARRLRDDFAVLLAVGFFSLFAVQAALNIGMNVGLAPVVGITLPFVSFGSSSLVASLAAAGIMQNLARNFGRQAPHDSVSRVDRSQYNVVP